MVADGKKPPFTVNIFKELHQMQSTHGLRSADFTRYRQYCQRRIRRTCKAQRFLHGTSKQYVKKKITPETVKSSGMVMLLLLHAERAWAYSEELKEANNAGALRKHHHHVSRLRRATKWSQDLHNISTALCDEVTQLQTEVYCSEKLGLLHIVKGDYEAALSDLNTAASALSRLVPLAPAISEQLAQKRAEVQQNRRLCAYKLGIDVSTLETFDTEVDMGHATQQVDLLWRGKPVNFYSEKLRQKVQEVQEQAEAIAVERAKPQDFTSGNTSLNHILELYDKLFICYQDAIALVKQDLRLENADSQQQHLVLNYLSVVLLEHTLQRNLLLVEAYTARFLVPTKEKAFKKATSPADIVRLYDLIIQNIHDVLAIPGVDDDAELCDKYQGSLLLHRGARLYWKAEAFHQAAQYTEAMACLTEAAQFISDCFAFQRAHHLGTSEAEEMSKKIRRTKCIVQGSAFMQLHKKGEQIAKDTAELSLQDERLKHKLVDMVNEYTECDEVIALPPSAPCVPCKPLFYDVAANYLQEVDISERCGLQKEPKPDVSPKQEEVKTPEPPPVEKKSGGWLSSFW